jgi:manganese oxidase
MGDGLWQRISRRMLLSGGAVSAGGALLTAVASGGRATAQGTHVGHGSAGLTVTQGRHDTHNRMLAVGEVDTARNGFDPTAMLTD